MEWVTTNDPEREGWWRILEYANEDVALGFIEARHGTNKAHKAFRRKQAGQVRVALQQASEYFSAAKTTSLYTSPNHLYYGVVGLATAVMLLRGTGEKSLDRLRQTRSNRSHGLEFWTSDAKNIAGLQILNSSFAKILPHGFLRNWYEEWPTLSSIPTTQVTVTDSIQRTSFGELGNCEKPAFDKLVSRRQSVLALLSRLPDLFIISHKVGGGAAGGRVDSMLTVRDDSSEWKMTIHAGTKDELSAVLDVFKVEAGYVDHTTVQVHGHSAIVTCHTRAGQFGLAQFPLVRHTCEFTQFAYSGEHDDPEFVDAYIASYCLSMLSRYYPDTWVRLIDSHDRAAKLIERFVSIYVRKFPLLTLESLVESPVIISTQHPPWR